MFYLQKITKTIWLELRAIYIGSFDWKGFRLLCIFLMCMGWSNVTKAMIADSLDVQFYKYTTLMNFFKFSSIANEVGTLNPSNRVAELNKFDIGFYLRPDLSFSLKKKRKILELSIKPRLNLARGEGFFFQEAQLKWHINSNWSFQGGRYLKELGTATIINPSNPFIFNATFLNPKIEQKPLGFAELNYSKGDWNFSFFSNYSKANNPIYEDPYFDFDPSCGVVIERYKAAEHSGVLLNLGKDKKLHLGAYNFKTVSNSLLVWVDAAISYNVNRFYPVEGHWTSPQLLEYDMINGPKNRNLFFSGVLGISYATKLGPTIKFEYYYNERGYKDDEFDLFNEMILSSSQYKFDLTVDLADSNLARGINPGMPFLRRNYFFGQVGGFELFGIFDYNFRALYSLDDGSAQFSSLLEWNIGELQFFSLSILNAGSQNSDLKRLIDNQFWLGVIYKI